MEKVPLHNLFEKVLGIGKINTREEFDALVAKLKAYAAANPKATVEEAAQAVAKEEKK